MQSRLPKKPSARMLSICDSIIDILLISRQPSFLDSGLGFMQGIWLGVWEGLGFGAREIRQSLSAESNKFAHINSSLQDHQ